MTTPNVNILHGSLVEQSNGEVVLRGVVDPASIPSLLVDVYQREDCTKGTKIGKLMAKAISQKAHFPDIELGLRGQNYENGKGDTYTLNGRVYIIDGYQRVSALVNYMEENPGKPLPVAIGAKVHFGTTRETERKLFDELNGPSRRRLSPNVMLRNLKDKSDAILTLYALSTTDQTFPLCGRVTWSQQMLRSDLITATSLTRTVYALLRPSLNEGIPVGKGRRLDGPSTGGGGGRDHLQGALDRMATKMGLSKYRTNVHRFFDVVDDCWGIRDITFTRAAVHLRGNFLTTLALIFADHENFWKNGLLTVDADFKRRLKSFPINDPEIGRLASAGHMAIAILYDIMRKHLNKRRREEFRLRRRGDLD